MKTYDYIYDAENHLTQAKKNGSAVADLTYDSDGRRAKEEHHRPVLFQGRWLDGYHPLML